ncbi:protein-L-isoaspartate O-methyltransferase family protein [Candidatus Vesicomyidisocius calyptogenae]|uniref:Protein-L-isoaspartate O-methyltransferase n=1 Tax=Vesicomyosocius okutanii subsp. Calyptogena okutanii (strain HA) TaxID=412965 RepID=A5CVP3_VESOH|nr:protein-L-isoaspartate O-methyltransferase [Candidatus Vesicomyosocius okutanii]BAF61970.1 protein-L-isoaspartate(D-aspartate) O-methyltransferase [Candidatus Vesicomyosocius okutanii]
MNIKQARKNVIEQQIRPWGGLNYIANNALKDTPREDFVPEKYKNLTFADIEIPLTSKAKMLFPKIEGRLLNALNIKKHETVLEIGTGSGYLTAVLSKLCKSVTSIEIDENLSHNAKKRIDTLGIDNVTLEVVDASKNWKYNDFFNVVIISSSVPKITGYYFHLLNIGGRIFVIEGTKNIMSAKLITRISKNKWDTKSLFETQLDAMRGLESSNNFEF